MTYTVLKHLNRMEKDVSNLYVIQESRQEEYYKALWHKETVDGESLQEDGDEIGGVLFQSRN